MPQHQKLLQHLSHELWQTEVSASQHCRREAARLGDVPPALVLLAAAEHADRVLAELPHVGLERPLAQSGVGMAVGKLFSEIRDSVVDKLLTSERSYRGTLLGLRHGVDVVSLMLSSARLNADRALVDFFEHWLSQRQPLVAAVAAELQWFAQRPERSIEHARGLFTN